MCIAGSVGRGGRNERDDVRSVQLLLNLNHPQITGPLVANGVCDASTIALIESFQSGVIGDVDAPGLVPPGGSTLAALRGGLPPGLLEEKLEGIYIHAAASRVSSFFPPLLAGMADAAIDTPLRQSHFLAQVGHESGELRYTEELATGSAYEGRKDLGNTQAGDGVRFKGRGLIQLTGRANYAAFGKAVELDLTANPQRVAAEPRLAVDAATWFWSTHHLNALADMDDTRSLTKKINGGVNGLADREAKLARAKWFLLPVHEDPMQAGLIHAMQAVAGDEDDAAQRVGAKRFGKRRRHRRRASKAMSHTRRRQA